MAQEQTQRRGEKGPREHRGGGRLGMATRRDPITGCRHHQKLEEGHGTHSPLEPPGGTRTRGLSLQPQSWEMTHFRGLSHRALCSGQLRREQRASLLCSGLADSTWGGPGTRPLPGWCPGWRPCPSTSWVLESVSGGVLFPLATAQRPRPWPASQDRSWAVRF